MVLSAATEIYIGVSACTEIYIGDTQVWPSSVPPTGGSYYLQEASLDTLLDGDNFVMVSPNYKTILGGNNNASNIVFSAFTGEGAYDLPEGTYIFEKPSGSACRVATADFFQTANPGTCRAYFLLRGGSSPVCITGRYLYSNPPGIYAQYTAYLEIRPDYNYPILNSGSVGSRRYLLYKVTEL